MSFSIHIPIGEDGKLGEPQLSGDLPLHLVPSAGVENHRRSITVHGHADKDGLTLGASMGYAHCQMFVPAEAFPKPKTEEAAEPERAETYVPTEVRGSEETTA